MALENVSDDTVSTRKDKEIVPETQVDTETIVVPLPHRCPVIQKDLEVLLQIRAYDANQAIEVPFMPNGEVSI